MKLSEDLQDSQPLTSERLQQLNDLGISVEGDFSVLLGALNTTLALELSSRSGGLHITIVGRSDEMKILKKLPEDRLQELNRIALEIQEGKGVEIKGIGYLDGSQSGMSDADSDKRAVFLAVDIPELQEFRSSLGFPPKDFHITLGFQGGDIHMRKGDQTAGEAKKIPVDKKADPALAQHIDLIPSIKFGQLSGKEKDRKKKKPEAVSGATVSYVRETLHTKLMSVVEAGRAKSGDNQIREDEVETIIDTAMNAPTTLGKLLKRRMALIRSALQESERSTLEGDEKIKGAPYPSHTLDPRPIAVANEANDTVFASGPILGIEVTIPSLAEKCVDNIDPQHSEGDVEKAAIEAAVDYPLPEKGTQLATVRADVDSVGAMAVMNLRARGENLDSAVDRIQTIATSDKFARGAWPGQRPLPSRGNPWPVENASANDTEILAAIAAAVGDFKKPLNERVALMEKWLLTGEEPDEYRELVERGRMGMITALEDGSIDIGEAADGKIATVNSTHMAATMLGYSKAPVVVALNPQFSMRGGPPHMKFTICQYQQGYVDLAAAKAELNTLDGAASEDAPWGGSPTILGSPQGIGTELDVDTVTKVIQKHLQK